MRNRLSFMLKATILLASMMTMMANAIIAPAMPAISAAFDELPNAEFLTKLMMTLPALSIAVSAPFAGILVDRWGRIRVLVTSLILYAAAGTSGLWLNDLVHILVGRFILGFGVAGIMTAATTLIGDFFTDAQRNAFMGIQGMFMGIGGMVFISSAGVLADHHWRYPFYIYGFSLLVLFLTFRYLYEPDTEKEKQEGVAGESPGFFRVFRKVWLIFFSAFAGMMIFYLIPVQLPYYVMGFEGVTKTQAGLALSAMTATQTIMAAFYRFARARFSYTSIYAICFTLMGAGLLFLGLGQNYIQSILAAMVFGMGAGWLMPNASLWMMASVDVSVRGRYIGILSVFTFSGMLLSPVFIQPVQNALGMSEAFVATAFLLALLSLFYASVSLRKARLQKNFS